MRRIATIVFVALLGVCARGQEVVMDVEDDFVAESPEQNDLVHLVFYRYKTPEVIEWIKAHEDIRKNILRKGENNG